MKLFEKFIADTSNVMYTYVLIIILVLAGLYFTFRMKFAQFRLLGEQIKCVTEKPKDGKGVSSFQALMVSTASRVGTGNIIGVSTAICSGGYGAVFWMWVIAIIGSASAFIESTLAQIFKKKSADGTCYGGPAYYIEYLFKNKIVSTIFMILLILTYGVGFNMLASYNLQSTFSSYPFYNDGVTPWIIGGIIALLVAICLFGGGKRIVKTTSFLVPIMGIAYIFIAIIVIIANYYMLPDLFKAIFKNAFDFKAIFGGFTGSCVMYGIKRGLFSNEAGVGSAPNASASAEVAHPAKQGLVQVLSVFIDTLLVCTATAFLCICSGIIPSKEIAGAPYVQLSVMETLGTFGPVFITMAMALFAFTTLIGNLFYVDKSFDYLLGKTPGKVFKSVYYVIASLLIFVGAGLNSDLLWNISDVFMGLMTIINVPVIFILGKYAYRTLKDYEQKRKSGKEITFCAKDIGIEEELDYWQ